MPAQIDQFSGVASVRVLPDRGSCAVCGGRFSRIALVRGLPDRRSWAVCDGPLSGITSQKRTSVRSHRNPVPSCHYTHGRTGWREGY